MYNSSWKLGSAEPVIRSFCTGFSIMISLRSAPTLSIQFRACTRYTAPISRHVPVKIRLHRAGSNRRLIICWFYSVVCRLECFRNSTVDNEYTSARSYLIITDWEPYIVLYKQQQKKNDKTIPVYRIPSRKKTATSFFEPSLFNYLSNDLVLILTFHIAF